MIVARFTRDHSHQGLHSAATSISMQALPNLAELAEVDELAATHARPSQSVGLAFRASNDRPSQSFDPNENPLAA